MAAYRAMDESQEDSNEENDDDDDDPMESISKRYYILKYSLNHIGRYELRYVDEHGDIHYSYVKNIDGILKLGTDVSISNWAKISSIFKRVYDLYAVKS